MSRPPDVTVDEYEWFLRQKGWPLVSPLPAEILKWFGVSRWTIWRRRRELARRIAMQRLANSELYRRFCGRRAEVTTRGDHPDLIGDESYVRWLQERSMGNPMPEV